jgi:hypothetical protein
MDEQKSDYDIDEPKSPRTDTISIDIPHAVIERSLSNSFNHNTKECVQENKEAPENEIYRCDLIHGVCSRSFILFICQFILSFSMVIFSIVKLTGDVSESDKLLYVSMLTTNVATFLPNPRLKKD